MKPILIMWGLYAVFFGVFWFWATHRPHRRKAWVKRRLLVREGDELVWRSVRARCLVGWPADDGTLSWGTWVSSTEGEWAVLQARRGRLIAYHVSDEKAEKRKVGTVQVCQPWRELEAAVPAKVFEEALVAAGFKKPEAKYREVPL